MFEEIIRRLNELEQKEFYLLVQNPLTAYCKTFSFFFFFLMKIFIAVKTDAN